MKNTVILMASAVWSMQVLAQEPMKIKGDLKGLGNETIQVSSPLGDQQVQAKNGKFELTLPAGTEPIVITLNSSFDRNIYLGSSTNSMSMPAQPLEFVLAAGANVEIKGEAEHLNLATVSGDPLNDGFTAVRKGEEEATKAMREAQKEFAQSRIMGVPLDREAHGKRLMGARIAIQESRKSYITANPNSFASIYFLSRLMREIDESEVKSLYEGLGDAYKGSRYAAGIRSKIESAALLSENGPAPVFVKNDLNGKAVSLADFKGKYVLLDFWGSWCGPCRANNPHLIKLYEQYKDKGFEIVGVASERVNNLQEADKLWREAVEKDGLPWVNVLNNEGRDKVDVVQLYAIEAYPTHFLIDREGRIVEKFVGAENKGLEKRLAAIFPL